jgi:hypothetical protein
MASTIRSWSRIQRTQRGFTEHRNHRRNLDEGCREPGAPQGSRHLAGPGNPDAARTKRPVMTLKKSTTRQEPKEATAKAPRRQEIQELGVLAPWRFP